MLNRAKEYYKNNKESLREKAGSKYREVSEKQKHIKREVDIKKYLKKNKQRTKEYEKKLSQKLKNKHKKYFHYYYYYYYYCYLTCYKMNPKAQIFGVDCINKNGFHKNERSINIDEADITKKVLSSKHSYGNKGEYFIGYVKKNDPFLAPCIKFPQISGLLSILKIIIAI